MSDAEQKTYKWTVEFEVDATWVADGFNPDDDDFHEMLMARLPFAYSEELGAKIISKPDLGDLLKEQGYDADEIAKQVSQSAPSDGGSMEDFYHEAFEL